VKKIVIDTNVVFAMLRSRSRRLRHILGQKDLEFHTPTFLMVEIFKHKERILKSTKAAEEEVNEYLYTILSKINFVNESTISPGSFVEAFRLCGGVDEKDVPFVALALELEADLWTRDTELKISLVKNGFDRLV
jgi:predicted nucleic acid-binding protein